MSNLIEVNDLTFTTAMNKLNEGVRKGIVDPSFGTLPVQARLLTERCQQFTPPRNNAQGRVATTRDITGIFNPISEATWTNKSIKKIVRNDDRTAWWSLARRLPEQTGLRNTTAESFSEALHQRLRNRRGSVGRSNLRSGRVTLGAQARNVRSYIQQKKKLVGWARAGWNAAIIQLGGKIKEAWVARHGLGRGSVSKALDAPDPYIIVRNETSWAGVRNAEGNRIVRNAIVARTRDMISFVNRAMTRARDAAGG